MSSGNRLAAGINFKKHKGWFQIASGTAVILITFLAIYSGLSTQKTNDKIEGNSYSTEIDPAQPTRADLEQTRGLQIIVQQKLQESTGLVVEYFPVPDAKALADRDLATKLLFRTKDRSCSYGYRVKTVPSGSMRLPTAHLFYMSRDDCPQPFEELNFFFSDTTSFI